MASFTDSSFEDSLNTKQPVNIREAIHKYMYHWPVFVLSLILAYTAAYLYLRYTPPVYSVKMNLLIKDARSDNNSMLKELSMFQENRSVDNEIQILKSKSLMQEVVQKLDLNVSYQTKGRAFVTDIYSTRPFSVVHPETETPVAGASVTVRILNSQTYLAEVAGSQKKWSGFFDSMSQTPIGLCMLKKEPAFNSYIGQTIYVGFKDVDAAAGKILGNLSINPVNKSTSVIELNLNDGVPERAKLVLDTLVKVYSQAAIDDKNQSVKNSIKFIKDRLTYITTELNSVEGVVQRFKTDHGFVEISGQAIQLLQEAKDNDAKLNAIDIQLKALTEVNRFVNAGGDKGDLPSFTGINDPAIANQVTQLNSLEIQRQKLATTTTDANPIMEAVDKQIISAKANLRTTMKNAELSLTSAKQALELNNNRFENIQHGLPAQEREFVNIKRQYNIKENLYLLLLQKMEEAALSSAVTLADNRIVERPYGSGVPVSPKKSSVYLICFAAGILLPFAYVFSKDSLNFRVISNKDITERTAAPILGDIMFEEGLSPVVLTDNSRSLIAEQFRVLRTNLQYVYGVSSGSRVTLFTSSMPGEGKSFISTNMATALAMTDRKTVILELDLRKPKVSRYLNLKNKTGLSNYLIGKATMQEIVQPSGLHRNLFVISSGPIPPNPAELLEQRNIGELIKWLRSEFQEIIIDTPPIGLVTDAMILSQMADASIYVVRHGLSLKSQIVAIEQLRQEKKLPKLNIVHNGVQISGRFGYGYASKYGYGYGYGYSYGNYYSETIRKKRKRLGLPPIVTSFLKRF